MTIAELRTLVTRALQALLPAADTSPKTPLYQLGSVVAAVAGGVHQRLDVLRRDLVPSTATYEGALVWGQALGESPRGPTIARGKAALQIQGPASTSVADGTQLRAETNQVIVEIDGAQQTDSNGLLLADVRTVDTGGSANLPIDTVCRFLSTPAGFIETAQVIAPLTGGQETEPNGTYQARVANFFAEPPQGGNAADYRRWIEDALTDVLVDGYALPKRLGNGTVDLVGLAIADRANRLLTSAQESAIANYVAELAPVTDDIRIISPLTSSVDIEVQLTPVDAPPYAFDFDDGGGLTVQTWTAATRRVQLTADLPADLQPNDRVSFHVATGTSSGQEQRVAAIIADDTIELVNDPSNPVPTDLGNGDTMYSGGPLVAIAREAILNGYTLVGGLFMPGVNQLGPANTNTRYGSWMARLDPSRVAAAARAQPGVDAAVCVNPATVLSPTDPADVNIPTPEETTWIGLIVAREVLVRR